MIKLFPGDKRRLLRPLHGRYSGYGGRPVFTAPAGAIVTIKSGPHPNVRSAGEFYNCDVAGWPEGVSIWQGDTEGVTL